MREGKKILVADDEPAILKIIKLRLEHQGFEVIAANDGQEALERLEVNKNVDLILLDIKMPRLSGFEVCQKLKKDPKASKIPIILFTASSLYQQVLVDRCVELGVTHWLKKPFGTRELLGKIEEALEEVSHNE